MAEYDITEAGGRLTISGTYVNTLDIEGFAQMMKDPSYCYKFYWLEAIVNLISLDVAETTFDEIIDEMIANAWYSSERSTGGWAGARWPGAGSAAADGTKLSAG